MKLPFAVFTARAGAQWISGLDTGKRLLEQLRRAIGKLPSFDDCDPLACGAVNLDDIVVVYKFMNEEKGDFRGRDALYLALTYFDRSIAGSINLERLLAIDVFSAPQREPPSCLEYSGPASMDSGADPESLGGTVALDAAGALFQRLRDGTLRLVQVEGAQQSVATYIPPVVEVAVAVPCAAESEETGAQIEQDALLLAVQGRRWWQWAVAWLKVRCHCFKRVRGGGGTLKPELRTGPGCVGYVVQALACGVLRKVLGGASRLKPELRTDWGCARYVVQALAC